MQCDRPPLSAEPRQRWWSATYTFFSF